MFLLEPRAARERYMSGTRAAHEWCSGGARAWERYGASALCTREGADRGPPSLGSLGGAFRNRRSGLGLGRNFSAALTFVQFRARGADIGADFRCTLLLGTSSRSRSNRNLPQAHVALERGRWPERHTPHVLVNHCRIVAPDQAWSAHRLADETRSSGQSQARAAQPPPAVVYSG